MRVFRRLYYKIVTLACIIALFYAVFNTDNVGVGYALAYMLIGFLCFGSWSIGKEKFDPEKPIRNFLLLLGWSLIGFGITFIGIMSLMETEARPRSSEALIVVFTIAGFALIIAYIVSIIKNGDWLAILSIVLLVGGCFMGSLGNKYIIFRPLTLIAIFAALACFVLSLIKGACADDDD